MVYTHKIFKGTSEGRLVLVHLVNKNGNKRAMMALDAQEFYYLNYEEAVVATKDWEVMLDEPVAANNVQFYDSYLYGDEDETDPTLN